MSSSFRSVFFRDINVKRLWSAWTRGHIFGAVARRCRRERVVREVLQCFRQAFFKPRRTLLMSVTAAYNSRSEESVDRDVGITDGELESLLSELESVKGLVKATLQCKSCGRRVPIDKKHGGVQYCDCKDGHPPEESFDGWVPYMEAEDVIIWRKEYKPGQGLYAYKVYGRYPEVSARDFAAVQLDGAYRRVWDAAVAALAVVQRSACGVQGQAVLHWEVLWPRLFANRDYVYIRRHKEFDAPNELPVQNALRVTPTTSPYEVIDSNVHARAKRRSMEMYDRERDGASLPVDNKVYIIVSRSCEHPDVPQTKHAIRVVEYWSHMVVKTVRGADKPGMEFVLTYYDEPAVGGMPGGVAAWASGRAAPAYLARMRRAARDYREWASGKEDNQEMPDFTPFDPGQVDGRIEDKAKRISEQDMESSKDGPELETCDTKDQSTQTEEVQIVRPEEKEETRVEQETKEEKKVDETLKEEVEICHDDPKASERGDIEVKGKDDVEVKSSEKSGEGVDSKRCEKNNEQGKTIVSSNGKEIKETNPEGEENNGSWWRYLYPFYYFV